MQSKLFEVRDNMTFIPVMATRPGGLDQPEAERYLWGRGGWGGTPAHQMGYIILMSITGGGGMLEAYCDPFAARSITIGQAHDYIKEHWDELVSGQVIDLEFIRGESEAPKLSERIEMAERVNQTFKDR